MAIKNIWIYDLIINYNLQKFKCQPKCLTKQTPLAHSGVKLETPCSPSVASISNWIKPEVPTLTSLMLVSIKHNWDLEHLILSYEYLCCHSMFQLNPYFLWCCFCMAASDIWPCRICFLCLSTSPSMRAKAWFPTWPRSNSRLSSSESSAITMKQTDDSRSFTCNLLH